METGGRSAPDRSSVGGATADPVEAKEEGKTDERDGGDYV